MSVDLGRLLRTIFALCLSGATYNHAATLAQYGLFFDYGGRPWPLCAYWTALTLLDPAAVVLLFAWPRAGLIATVAIISSDVIVNCAVTGSDVARYGWQGFRSYLMLIEQLAFFLFVVFTARIAWKQKT